MFSMTRRSRVVIIAKTSTYLSDVLQNEEDVNVGEASVSGKARVKKKSSTCEEDLEHKCNSLTKKPAISHVLIH